MTVVAATGAGEVSVSADSWTEERASADSSAEESVSVGAHVPDSKSFAAASGQSPATENRTLVVADAETNASLLEVPVADGDELTLAYTHSVEKTAVEDVYEVDGTTLQMDRMVFSSYGAGLPSEAAVNRTDEGFVVSVDRSFDRIHVSPGSIAGHVLQVGDECYDLVALSEESTVVLFVEERPTEGEPGSPTESAGGLEECGGCS